MSQINVNGKALWNIVFRQNHSQGNLPTHQGSAVQHSRRPRNHIPAPYLNGQSWLANWSSNPGLWFEGVGHWFVLQRQWSKDRGHWLLTKLLSKIRSFTLSRNMLSYWYHWKSGVSWHMGKASNLPSPAPNVPRFVVQVPDFQAWCFYKIEPLTTIFFIHLCFISKL